MIIEYFLPYNNFITLFSIAILNIILIFKRSYWQTFLVANLLLIAVLFIIGFNPVEMATDIVYEMFKFFENILKQFWQSLKDLIFGR